MNDTALSFVADSIDFYQNYPYTEENSFRHWTLTEIFEAVSNHPWDPASETVWNLELLFRSYVFTAVTSLQKLIFTVAADTAAELLECLKEIEEVEV